MFTERPPRDRILLEQFVASDRLKTLSLPPEQEIRIQCDTIASAMEDGRKPQVQEACVDFLAFLSDFYGVDRPGLRVLAARPLRVYDSGGSFELFGDYTPRTQVIRLWMRTAVRKQVTSFGTFLSTLCHEFVHHLDCRHFGFKDSPHTRGFYERTALLYHLARGTPLKQLRWVKFGRDCWRIDWQKTNRTS